MVQGTASAVAIRATRWMQVSAMAVQQCRVLLPLIALQAVSQGAPGNLPLMSGVRLANALLLLTTLPLVGLRAVRGVAHGVISFRSVHVEDNLHARFIYTQTRMLTRTAIAAIVLAGLALMLMTFPGARQISETSPDWDGRVCKLQVTEAGEDAIQLQLLVTSENLGRKWDLRCSARETLVNF